MDQVFQALIHRSRVLLDLKTIKTILGQAPAENSQTEEQAGGMGSSGRETCV